MMQKLKLVDLDRFDKIFIQFVNVTLISLNEIDRKEKRLMTIFVFVNK